MTEYTAQMSVLPTEDVIAHPRSGISGTITPGVTTTIGRYAGNIYKGGAPRAPYFADTQTALAVNGNTVELSNLHYNRVRKSGFLNGGWVRVYRVVPPGQTVTVRNGSSHTNTNAYPELVLIRKDTIADQQGRTFKLIAAELEEDDEVITAETVDWKPDGWHQPDALTYFAVRSVDSNGDWSDWCTPASGTTSDNTDPINFSLSNSVGTQAAGAYNGALSAPTGLAVSYVDPDGNLTTDGAGDGEVLRLTWDPVGGAVGYEAAWSPYVEMDEYSAITLAGDETAPLAVDDWIVFGKEFLTIAAHEDVTFPRIWNASAGTSGYDDNFNILPWPGGETRGTYMEESGVHFMRVTVEVDNSNVQFGTTSFGGTAQFQRPVMEVGKTYGFRIRMRSPDAPVTADFTAQYATIESGSESITISSDWADYDLFFTYATEHNTTSSAAQYVRFANQALGTVIDVENVYVYEAGPAPLVEWRPRVLSILQDGTPPAIRFHSSCKTRPWSYDLSRLVQLPGSNSVYGIGLYAMFALCLQVGSQPWIQIEMHWSEDDLLGLMEYIHAPYDAGAGDTPASKPWAYLRTQQGRSAPWSDAFSVIYFELSNENWQQGLVFPAFYTSRAISGYTGSECNAIVTDYFYEVMEGSPYADMGKWDFVIGGKNNSSSVNDPMLAVSRHAKHGPLIADYNGGWDSGVAGADPDDPASRLRVTSNAVVQARGENSRRDADKCAARTAERAAQGNTIPIYFGTYEAGPGYSKTGDDEHYALQSLVMRSIMAANATLDCFWTGGANGRVLQNFFTLDEGVKTWNNHTRWSEGGAVVPSYQWMQWWNNNLTGAALRDVTYLREQTRYIWVSSVNKDRDRSQCAYENMVGVLRADKGDVTYLMVFNRDTDTSHDVRVSIPHTSTVHRHMMIGPAGYTSWNQSVATAHDIAIIEDVVTPAAPLSLTLEPGELHVYEFGSTARNTTPATIAVPDRCLVSGGALALDLRPYVTGTGPFTWSITGPGVASANGSVVTMTDSVGTTTVTVEVTNAGGVSNTETFDVVIAPEMVTASTASVTGWTGINCTLSSDGSSLTATVDAGGDAAVSCQITGLTPGGRYRLRQSKRGGKFYVAESADLKTNDLAQPARDGMFIARASTLHFGVQKNKATAGETLTIRNLSVHEWM